MKRTLALALLVLLPAGLAVGNQHQEKKPMKNPTVTIKTSMGTIKAELYADKAPATVANVLAYVDDKFYDGTIFHRVINNFMIQGGGFDKANNKKPNKPPVKNEAANGLKNTVGTLAMARTNDPNSATSQFFINVVDNAGLDYRNDSPSGIGYCVFGKVTEGMDVVNKIKAVETGPGPMGGDVPKTQVVIESIRRD